MRVPLDVRRVVEIRVGWPGATSPPDRLGLLVSDDLILSIAPDTSPEAQELSFALAAIVGEDSEPGAAMGKREWFSCRMTWSSVTTDIALFRIDDPQWRNVVSAAPDRLGTFTGGMEWTAALVAGPRPFRVDIHPLNRRSISQFYLRIAEPRAPGVHVGPELSGAAVYAGELLIGVVSWDTGVGQVTVLPVTAAFDDPDFRRLLESPAANH